MKRFLFPLLPLILLTAIINAPVAWATDREAPLSASSNKTADTSGDNNDTEELLLQDATEKDTAAVKKSVAPAAAPDTAARAVKSAPAANEPAQSGETAPQPLAKPTVQAPSAVSKDTAATPPAATIKKEVDEELILDGGEESLLPQEKAAQSKTSNGGKSLVPDSTAQAGAGQKAPSSAGQTVTTIDSTTGQSPIEGEGESVVAGEAAHSSQPTPSAAKASAQTIENARSIDFATNLKEYRSPKLAMLMSLVIPGAGQVYAHSNIWAAAFVAVETAIISAGWVYVSKSNSQKRKAYSYADEHYDPAKLKTYSEDLRTFLRAQFSDNAKGDSVFDRVIFYDSGDVRFLAEAQNKSDTYYNDLVSESLPFVRGWNDVKPVFTESGFAIPPSETALWGSLTGDTAYLAFRKADPQKQAYGFSDFQTHYSDMISEAQSLSRTSRNIFMTLLVNHLASAVMAGIAAKTHNDELLGRQSFWDHIEIEQQLVNTGSRTVRGYAVQVRF